MAAGTEAGQGSSGAGQQTPFSTSSQYQMLEFIISQAFARIDTMKLVKVVKVTGGGGDTLAVAGTVDVQPLINLLDGDAQSTEQGTVFGVPWYRMQGGKNAVITDPKVGDVGFVVCSDRDISALKGQGDGEKKPANPGSWRRFNIADGIYIGGALAVTPEQGIIFTDDKIKLIDKSGNVVETSSQGIKLTPAAGLPVTVTGNFVVTGNLQLGGNVQAQNGGVYAGNLQIGGTITAGFGTGTFVTLQNHRHPANNSPPTPGF